MVKRLLLCLLSASPVLAQWTVPTAEELAMTSIAEVPGAPAVVLYREETTEDALRMHSYYVRVKVLTEGGKEYANVELPFGGNAGISLDKIEGRTIHPDGSMTPFTGKPYEKLMLKAQGFKVKQKVFTLPAVEVGSILEYRYRTHYDDAYFMHPDWYIQTELFTRKAHYSWKPNASSSNIVDNRGEVLSEVAWTPILPVGVKVQESKPIGGGSLLQLDIENVPPLPREEYMPPIGSVSYRVLFYYTAYRTAAEFWEKQGKFWSKDRDRFIGPGGGVKTATAGLVAAGDTPEQKLRKIYAFVTTLENTDFTRERTSNEEKAGGLKAASSTDDILSRKRGSGDQMAELFVAMARAAGMKAYLVAAADRQHRLFLPSYLSLSQLDDYLATVSVEGRDLIFDPGQRYCPFGHVAWQHTVTGGLRQTDGGVALVTLPAASYKDEHISRVADLVLDEHGAATGTVVLSYRGDPALRWRQEALRGDDTALNADLKESLERMLPGGMDVRVLKVDNLANAEAELKVSYEVKGAVGTPTGRRLLLGANLFEVNTRPRFPGTKREVPVDMRYPLYTQDAVRFKVPQGLAIESFPAAGSGVMKDEATFSVSSKKTDDTITLYRNVTIGQTIFGAGEYADLRGFYAKLEAKDQEAVVLTREEGARAKARGN